MKKEQLERMRELSEKLADVVLTEADPDNWPAKDTPLGEMTQQERGDRYWCKKNATATFALLMRTETIIADGAASQGHLREEPPELEQELRQHEKAAAAALDQARKRAGAIVKRSSASG